MENMFKDFLIISYNEGAATFNASDCEQIIKDMFSKLKINYLENKKNELKIQVLNFDGPPIEEGKLMKSVEEIIKEIEKIKKEGCQDLLDVI